MNAQPNQHAITVEGLRTQIGDHVIHDGLDLQIRKGEILGLVGGSGSGKTLLLRTIIMLREATAGTVRLFGMDTKELEGAALANVRRRFAMMFQQGALFSSLSVLENVAMPIREHLDLSQSTVEELARLKIRFVGLPENSAAKFPSELSGGMLKRAAVARSLALDPDVLFLDEPTAGLDPIAAHDLDEFVLELRASLGLTVVVVTHDLDSLWHMTDRVAYLADKRVVAVADLATLSHHPHPQIADYFGGPRGRASTAAHI